MKYPWGRRKNSFKRAAGEIVKFIIFLCVYIYLYFPFFTLLVAREEGKKVFKTRSRNLGTRLEN
jgi:hypothetical protein